MSGTQNWTTWWGRLLLAVCVLFGGLTCAPQRAEAVYWWPAIVAGGALLYPTSTSEEKATSNDAPGVVETIRKTFEDGSKKWVAPLRAFATSLFWLLVSIEVTWTAISLAIKGSELGDWLQAMVNQIFFIGFFAALLFWSDEWARAIISSFQQAAAQTAAESLSASSGNAGLGTSTVGSVTSLDPGSVAGTAWSVATAVWRHGSGNMLDSLLLSFVALGILVSLMAVAAQILIVQIESYIVVGASVLMMGFGGSRWTKDYAVKTLNYAVAVGAKLFVLQLIVVLGLTIINQLIAGAVENPTTFFTTSASTGTSTSLGAFKQDVGNVSFFLLLLGVVVVFYMLSQAVPDLVQGLLAGALIDTSASRFVQQAHPTPWGVAKGAGTVVLGAGMAGYQIDSLASARTAAAELGGTGHWKSWGANFAASAFRMGVSTIGLRLSGGGTGRFNPSEGTFLGQVSHAARRRADALREDNAERAKKNSDKADSAQAKGASGADSGGGKQPDNQKT